MHDGHALLLPLSRRTGQSAVVVTVIRMGAEDQCLRRRVAGPRCPGRRVPRIRDSDWRMALRGRCAASRPRLLRLGGRYGTGGSGRGHRRQDRFPAPGVEAVAAERVRAPQPLCERRDPEGQRGRRLATEANPDGNRGDRSAAGADRAETQGHRADGGTVANQVASEYPGGRDESSEPARWQQAHTGVWTAGRVLYKWGGSRQVVQLRLLTIRL